MAESCLTNCPTIKNDLRRDAGFDAFGMATPLPVIGGNLGEDCQKSYTCPGVRTETESVERTKIGAWFAKKLGKPATKTIVRAYCQGK